MSVIRTYRSPHGPGGKMRRSVHVGKWLHWSPFNERPRLIVKVLGRKFVVSDQVVFDQPWNRTPRFRRLATGIEVHVGRVRFSTVADR